MLEIQMALVDFVCICIHIYLCVYMCIRTQFFSLNIRICIMAYFVTVWFPHPSGDLLVALPF